MQGESREDLSPCDPLRGVSCLRRTCSDSALTSWYAGPFPEFIEKCGRLIADEAGENDVEGLILTGSFATREGSVAFVGGRAVFLSDLDLLLVVSSREAHGRIYPRRAEIGKACESLMPEAVFEGRVDLGVMCSAELRGMALSPGVYNMRSCGMLLSGDAGVMDLLPDFEAGEIGAGEALRLLENRMAAFLGSFPGKGRPEGTDLMRFLYGVSRVYTDIITASLCIEGLYRPGYGARSRFLLEADEAGEVREALGASLTGDSVRWSSFKTDPSEEKVWDEGMRARKVWMRAAGDIMAVRDRIARDRRSAGSGGRRPLPELMRSWRAAARGGGPLGRLRIYANAVTTGLTPALSLREESVRLYRQATEKGTERAAGSARGGYPHGRCSWEDAAAAVYSEWNRLVTGREKDE